MRYGVRFGGATVSGGRPAGGPVLIGGVRTCRGPAGVPRSGMAFDLHRADGEVIRHDDAARFSFTATGHLVVYDAHGNKTVYSHHSWDRIEEPVPPPRPMR